jgi:DNA-binding HxlR family transcriptional regulator
MPRPTAFKTSAPRSRCPVARTLDVVGDRWSLLVIRDIATGRHHFDAMMASPEAIAPNILAGRLRALTAAGLISVRRDPADARRQLYRLTRSGEKFAVLVRLIARWGLDNLPGTADPRGLTAHADAAPRRAALTPTNP